MQLTTFFLATLTALASITSASPSPSTSAVDSTSAKKSQPFRLKTSLHNPKKNKRHNNLYLGASQLNTTSNDIYLEKTMPVYASHLNGTDLMFNLTNAFGETTWSMENLEAVPYTGEISATHSLLFIIPLHLAPMTLEQRLTLTTTGWQSAQINAGYADPTNSAFYLNATTGLQSSVDNFGGWRVCDWWHGDTQLFWIVKYYAVPAPGSCSDVDLVADYSAYEG